MDFDALAAQFAVTKLYAGTRILPGYPLVGNVREFLALYRDTLPLSQLKYLDLEKVNHIYIVDCQHVNRLDELAQNLLRDKKNPRSYTIFDHHQVDPDGLGPGAREDSIIKPVGSTTSIMVEQLIEKGIELTPFEATLLAIGIYEDTGCLTYRGTTELDASCLAFLLKNGADLGRINDYLHPKLNDHQTKLLEELVKNVKIFMVGGVKAAVATADLADYQEGLATLTRKLVEVESLDAAVTVVRMRDRIHVVGRSDTPAIDVRMILRHFGGDGHAGAASGVTRDKTVDQVAKEVVDLITQSVKPEITAIEVMQSPVRTIRSKTTMEEAYRIMLRYASDGLVVTEGDDVVGVVSRRDIDQAMHHKLGHAPVQGFMSRPVITISPVTPLSQIEHLMVKEDIGRLPVIDDQNQLIGIVSRLEVLKTRYGKNLPDREEDVLATHKARYGQFREKLDDLDEATKWLFAEIGKAAAQLNMVAYAVGGCVRDLYLGRGNFDLDFVVEGATAQGSEDKSSADQVVTYPAVALAQCLESLYPGRLKVVAKHDRFQTATLEFMAGQKLEVDLATARTEFYEFPAALPTVEASSLRQDLFRRDFTINALAICLNPGQYGEVVDYFGGLDDLEARLIRILHPFSFIEDPTRIVRAARFAARLDFSLESRTKQQAERAIGMGIFDNLGGVRLRTELRLILESSHRLDALDLLGEMGGKLRYLDAELTYGPTVRQLIRRAERLIERTTDGGTEGIVFQGRAWVVYLGLLVSQLSTDSLARVLDRLQLANDDIAHIESGIALPRELQDLGEGVKRSEIYNQLHGRSDETLAIAASLAAPGTYVRRAIKLYLEELKGQIVELSGSDLLAMGYPQGPILGQIRNAILVTKLDGQIKSKQDEQAYALRQFPIQVSS
jgi:tRNA nucleotidyltransferase (CCA-adding enzyme)